MIEYINKTNIDDRILIKAKNILENGGIVAYPTDTNWGIGCSVQSSMGISKLRKLKGDFQNYTLTMICSNISQISDVTELNNPNFKIIKKYTPGPYVFILSAQKRIEKKINMKRIEIGVRIPSNPISIKLVEKLNSPIFSITASKKMTSREWWDDAFAEENLLEYGWELEEISSIDLILDTGAPQSKVLSTVVDLTKDTIHIIRHGIGVI
ncbi:MAG: threonylcarbamoyl-AMP synthase [Spirochaetes bacterium]|nr:threonylcarbamoyl-AMP synthase [Spirochaetota bacterium]